MMRRTLGPALGVLLLAGAIGCNTTQPVQGGPQNGEIRFEANTPKVPIFDVWDAEKVSTQLFPDQPGRPPFVTRESLGLWCEQTGIERQDTKYPYLFSVDIERIPAGTSVVEPLTSPSYATSLSSVTEYDDSEITPAETHPVNWSMDISVPDSNHPNTTTVLALTNGIRVSTTSREFLRKPKIAADTSTSYGSRCPFGGPDSAKDLGTPGVAGHAGSFPLQIGAGDTIIVKARKDINPAGTALFTSNPPNFGSRVFVEGREITDSVLGRAGSPPGTDQGLSYSFTVR